MSLCWKGFFSLVFSIYCKLRYGCISVGFTTFFKWFRQLFLKFIFSPYFRYRDMILTNLIRLVLQHSHESFFWSRPHLKDTRWSTRWSKILWRSPRQTWRSWGERAKARMQTSTRTRKARWDEHKNSYSRDASRTHTLFVWHMRACSQAAPQNDIHSQTLTPEMRSQCSSSWWCCVWGVCVQSCRSFFLSF